MTNNRKPAGARKPTRSEGARYEICKVCGLDWNVSIKARIGQDGYLCPRCRGSRRKEQNHE